MQRITAVIWNATYRWEGKDTKGYSEKKCGHDQRLKEEGWVQIVEDRNGSKLELDKRRMSLNFTSAKYNEFRDYQK